MRRGTNRRLALTVAAVLLLGAPLGATIPVARAGDAPTSLVDWLKVQGQDASYDARRRLFADRFPDEAYSGTAEQNLRLLSALRAEVADGGAARPNAEPPAPEAPAPREPPDPAPDASGTASVGPGRTVDVGGGWWAVVDARAQTLGIDVAPVRRLRAQDGESDAPISAWLARSAFVSAAILVQKAKTFDDGLYAAVELAAQEGAGRFPGKRSMLDALRARLGDVAAADASPASAAPFAAARVRNDRVSVPPALVRIVDAQVAAFEREAVLSKPIGFYTWSEPLRAIFRQDRVLQPSAPPDAGTAAVARALRDDVRTRATYEAYVALVERLTNPFVAGDYRPVLSALDLAVALPTRPVALVPASRSNEAEMLRRLMATGIDARSIDVLDAFVDGVRTGRVSLAVRRDSGWYDRQQWALEPFLRPETTVERARVAWSDPYRARMEQLFRGALALTRETHVKSVETPPTGAPAAPVRVTPDLTVEPHPTAWLRRADSYRYVRSLLTTVFGPAGLASMRRWTPDGPVLTPLDRELAAMETLFTGAYARSCREIGQPAGAVARLDAAEAMFRAWSERANEDVDLSRDLRMVVPVLHDRETGKTKVIAFLGWATQAIEIRFARPPAIYLRRSKDARGEEPAVALGAQEVTAAYPVIAEAWTSRIPDREEFRRLCDEHRTRAAIVEALQR